MNGHKHIHLFLTCCCLSLLVDHVPCYAEGMSHFTPLHLWPRIPLRTLNNRRIRYSAPTFARRR